MLYVQNIQQLNQMLGSASLKWLTTATYRCWTGLTFLYIPIISVPHFHLTFGMKMCC